MKTQTGQSKMQPNFPARYLQHIGEEWKKLKPFAPKDEPTAFPPWAVWIREYPSIPEPVEPRLPIIPNRAWLLDRHGVKERDPWAFARFAIVNWQQPWAFRNFRQRQRIFSGYYHEIAFAAFCTIRNSDLVYIERQWGTRYRQGYLALPKFNGEMEIERILWVS